MTCPKYPNCNKVCHTQDRASGYVKGKPLSRSVTPQDVEIAQGKLGDVSGSEARPAICNCGQEHGLLLDGLICVSCKVKEPAIDPLEQIKIIQGECYCQDMDENNDGLGLVKICDMCWAAIIAGKAIENAKAQRSKEILEIIDEYNFRDKNWEELKQKIEELE